MTPSVVRSVVFDLGMVLSMVSSPGLRVGINFGNALLASRDASSGAPRGIAFDLAEELGRRLHVPIEVVGYETAAVMADAAQTGAWDVAFLATDPGRTNDITFTAPYVEIEATYFLPAGSPLRTIADVDREGVRVAVADKSAYDLFLRRSIRHAELVRASGVDASVTLFFKEQLDALAGLRPLLVKVAQEHPGSRVLDGRFTAVQQAIGTPAGRDAAYLDEFVAAVKASGFVATSIERNGMRGLVAAA
jgi:polar amino acid transport system substrate-binding protein